MDSQAASTNQATMPTHTYRATMGKRGGIQIPKEVKRLLNAQHRDQILFHVQGQRIELEAEPVMTLEETYGSVEPINPPDDIDDMIRIAREEQAEKVISDMQT